jgi:hypothetical protein
MVTPSYLRPTGGVFDAHRGCAGRFSQLCKKLQLFKRRQPQRGGFSMQKDKGEEKRLE